MTSSLSSAKRVRQNAKRKLSNRIRASAVKSAVRKVDAAVASGDQAAIRQAVSGAYASIDKAAKASVLHKNTAARRKALVAKRAGAVKG
jgi:small subunit ribosomal protein S20